MTSPKQAFQKSAHFKEWANVAESSAFQAALFAALLQMQMNQPEALDQEMSHAQQQRLIGARQFMGQLTRLCDGTEPAAPMPVSKNLNHYA